MTESPPLPRAPVTALVAVKDELKNLPRCLESLAFLADVVVVDSDRDRAVEAVVHSYGRRYEIYPGAEVAAAPKRTWALNALDLPNDWILVVDADEAISPELGADIRAAVGRSGVDGYFLPFRLYFMDTWIRHCGWYPAFQLRLFRRGRGAYETPQDGWQSTGDVEVHERITVEGATRYLEGEVLHYDFKGVANWLSKHNRYSTWEAMRRVSKVDQASPTAAMLRHLFSRDPVTRRRGLREIGSRVPFRPGLTFVWMYVLRFGFLDGRAGFAFCLLHATHQWHVDLKTEELTRGEHGAP